MLVPVERRRVGKTRMHEAKVKGAFDYLVFLYSRNNFKAVPIKLSFRRESIAPRISRSPHGSFGNLLVPGAQRWGGFRVRRASRQSWQFLKQRLDHFVPASRSTTRRSDASCDEPSEESFKAGFAQRVETSQREGRPGMDIAMTMFLPRDFQKMCKIEEPKINFQKTGVAQVISLAVAQLSWCRKRYAKIKYSWVMLLGSAMATLKFVHINPIKEIYSMKLCNAGFECTDWLKKLCSQSECIA